MSEGEHLCCEVVVVGSGFAGSILARILARAPIPGGRSRRVVLVERGAHPRFALGESSTPLAAISLERLAHRHGLADLRAFAAYGRWSAAQPRLRRGLKRGFSFFAHRRGMPFGVSSQAEARLLVAASPSDELADAHWLRQDVDAELATRAQEAGVIFRDRTVLTGYEEGANGVVLRGERQGRRLTIEADFVVDASGRDGFLAGCLGLTSVVDQVPVTSSLLAGHFHGVHGFVETVSEEGTRLAAGPYPDDRAAVHHLLEEGWMYQLPFDHGVMSAGFLLPPGGDAGRLAAAASAGDGDRLWRYWRCLCADYPSLSRQFRHAGPAGRLIYRRRVQHRLDRAVAVGGRGRWLLLPGGYAFADPLFSTGIAWSLVAVERVASLWDGLAAGEVPEPAALAGYGALLSREASWIESLVATAYRAIEVAQAAPGVGADLRPFAAVAQLYFVAASFHEASQRLKPEGCDWPWEGFLACDEGGLRAILDEADHWLCTWEEGLEGASWADRAAEFERWIGPAIEPWNIAGLADPRRQNLYPVDFAPLVAGAAKLGLSVAQVEAALPRLGGLG